MLLSKIRPHSTHEPAECIVSRMAAHIHTKAVRPYAANSISLFNLACGGSLKLLATETLTSTITFQARFY